MYNFYCNKLNITIPPLIQDVDTLELNDTRVSQLSLDLMHPEMKNFLSSLQITVPWIQIFYREPGGNSPVHTDGEFGDYVKLNFIYDGESSAKMNWFEPIKPVETKEQLSDIKFTDTNYRYIEWNRKEVTKVHSEYLNGSYLIQVGKPHSISHVKHIRYCISFILNKENKRVTMADACNIFNKWRAVSDSNARPPSS